MAGGETGSGTGAASSVRPGCLGRSAAAVLTDAAVVADAADGIVVAAAEAGAG